MLSKQNMNLVSDACNVRPHKESRWISLSSFGLGLLNRTAKPLALVYGQRFKEMRRDQEAIQYAKETSLAHSQFVRQSPK